MKRVGLICILIILCSLPGYSQFWISFNWNASHCDNCLWMEHALHLSGKRAAEYHHIIHKYGKKIEREARRDTRYWERSAERIYRLRMERDRALQRLLSPGEFRLYVRFIREVPTRIHDYRGWFNHPHHPHFRPSAHCHHYENSYWHCDWNYRNGHWASHYRPHSPSRPSLRPHNDGHRPSGRLERPGKDRGKNHFNGKYDRKREDNRRYQKDYKNRASRK